MKFRFFDYEVFKNWWCCSYKSVDIPDEFFQKLNWKTVEHLLTPEFEKQFKDSAITVTSDSPTWKEDYKQMFNTEDYMTGYNIKMYDLRISNAIDKGLTAPQVHIISDWIIYADDYIMNNKYGDVAQRVKYLSKQQKWDCRFCDLIDDESQSLKMKESALGIDIRESEVDFNKEDLTEEDKKKIIFYNKHDIYACLIFLLKVKPVYIQSKLLLGNVFRNIVTDGAKVLRPSQCIGATNPGLNCKILEAINRDSWSDEFREDIELHPLIKDYVKNHLPTEIYESAISNKGYQGLKEFNFTLFDNIVSFGKGGIHSVIWGDGWTKTGKASNHGTYIESDSEYMLVNADVTSFYPSIMILYDLQSRAIPKNCQSRFIKLFNDRIALKQLPKDQQTEQTKIQAGTYKIVLNSTYGAMGCKWLKAWDPYNCYKVCRTGQMILAALCYQLTSEIKKLKIIQTNTDGLLMYYPRNDNERVQKIIQDFSAITKLGMELDEEKYIFQKDVNNYIMMGVDGKLKNKGAWLSCSHEINLEHPKGILFAVQAPKNAAIKFLTTGFDIKEALRELKSSQDIRDYLLSANVGKGSYSRVEHRNEECVGGVQTVQFVSRIYATADKRYGKIICVAKPGGRANTKQIGSCPDHCKIVNENLDKWMNKNLLWKQDIDWAYYLDELQSLLNIRWYTINKNTGKQEYKEIYKI
jgi:DNA polymerase